MTGANYSSNQKKEKKIDLHELSYISYIYSRSFSNVKSNRRNGKILFSRRDFSKLRFSFCFSGLCSNQTNSSSIRSSTCRTIRERNNNQRWNTHPGKSDRQSTQCYSRRCWQRSSTKSNENLISILINYPRIQF